MKPVFRLVSFAVIMAIVTASPAADQCTALVLDSVGKISIHKDRIGGVARTAQGPNHAFYVRIVPNQYARENGVIRIDVLFNGPGEHPTPHCRTFDNEAGGRTSTCSLALPDSRMFANVAFSAERSAGDVDRLMHDVVNEVGKEALCH